MGYLRNLSLIVLFLLAIFIIASFISPSEKKTISSISINTSPSVVYNKVENLRSWENWRLWFTDNDEVTFSASDQNKDNTTWLQWESNTAGNGKLILENTIENELIGCTLLLDGMKTTNHLSLMLVETDSGSEATIAISYNDIPFFSRIFFSLFSELVNIDRGLRNLKTFCEATPILNIPKSDVDLLKINEISVYYISDSSDSKDIYQVLGAIFNEVMEHVAKTNATIGGMPFSRGNPIKEGEKWVFEAGFPIIAPGVSSDRVIAGKIEGGSVVSIAHFGLHNNIKSSYEKLDDYIKEKGLTLNGLPWEVYMSGPATETDTSKWETRIFYPVKL